MSHNETYRLDGTDEDCLERLDIVPTPEMPPLTGILLKRAGDIQRYREGDSKRKRFM